MKTLLDNFELDINNFVQVNAEMTRNIPGLYYIQFPNKKFYIGSSINLRKRLQGHFHKSKKLNHHNKHFQSTFNKYKDNIIVKIYYTLNISIARELEQKLLNKYVENTFCINVSSDIYIPVVARRVQIYEYSIEGNYVKTWDSISEAARFYNVTTSSIRDVLSGKSFHCRGRRFNRTLVDFLAKDMTDSKWGLFVVNQYTLNNELVNTFRTISEAKKAFKKKNPYVIKECIDKKRQTAYGYKWVKELLSVNNYA